MRAAMRVAALSSIHKFQPGGGSGQEGSGCHPGGGVQPGGTYLNTVLGGALLAYGGLIRKLRTLLAEFINRENLPAHRNRNANTVFVNRKS